MMSDDRISILDGSHSIFETNAKADLHDALVLQPIPEFREIIQESIRDCVDSGSIAQRQTVCVDVGVICSGTAVGILGWEIHRRIVKRLSAQMQE